MRAVIAWEILLEADVYYIWLGFMAIDSEGNDIGMRSVIFTIDDTRYSFDVDSTDMSRGGTSYEIANFGLGPEGIAMIRAIFSTEEEIHVSFAGINDIDFVMSANQREDLERAYSLFIEAGGLEQVNFELLDADFPVKTE